MPYPSEGAMSAAGAQDELLQHAPRVFFGWPALAIAEGDEWVVRWRWWSRSAVDGFVGARSMSAVFRKFDARPRRTRHPAPLRRSCHVIGGPGGSSDTIISVIFEATGRDGDVLLAARVDCEALPATERPESRFRLRHAMSPRVQHGVTEPELRACPQRWWS